MGEMRLRSFVLAAVLAACVPAGARADGGLGPRVELQGLSLRPPAGFQPIDVVGTETGALAPGAPGAPRTLLLSLLREPDALFAVSLVEAPLDQGPGFRDRLARAALDHASQALGVDMRLLWSEALDSGVELATRYRIAGSERGMLLAFLPLEERTVVVALAAPAETVAALEPAFAEVLASVERLGTDAPPDGRASGLVALLSLAGGAALAAASRGRTLPPSKRRSR